LEELATSSAKISPVGESELSVELTDWDPDAELKLAAAALYAVSEASDAELLRHVRSLSSIDRARIIAALVGQRGNRRHKPGRAMERTSYRFDVTCDFGAFRDLQRHRLMTIEWQRLTTRLGYQVPLELEDAGQKTDFVDLANRAGALYERVRAELGAEVAQYVVPFAYQIRFVMDMNAREALHLIELRTQPAGHPTYRAVCEEMHRQIAEVAGHHAIANAMTFVDHTPVELERLEAERRAEQKRTANLML
jgi:hypothetical protein